MPHPSLSLLARSVGLRVGPRSFSLVRMKAASRALTLHMASDPALQSALARFFQSSRAPVDNHEEWLLRTCAQLMHREAQRVSLSEPGRPSPSPTGEGQAKPPHNRNRPCRRASSGREVARNSTPESGREECQQSQPPANHFCSESAVSTDPCTETERTSWSES